MAYAMYMTYTYDISHMSFTINLKQDFTNLANLFMIAKSIGLCLLAVKLHFNVKMGKNCNVNIRQPVYHRRKHMLIGS